MKKTISILFILVLLLTGIHSTGEAALSGNLVLVPDAKVIYGNGELAGEISSNRGKISGLVKLTPWLEIGGAISSGGQYSETNFSPLAKILIINEYNYGLDLASGIRDKDLYFTAAKTFDYGVKGHLGLGNGNMGGLFVGITKVFDTQDIQISKKGSRQDSVVSSIPPIRLSAEYYNQSFNFGVRANVNNMLIADLSVVDLNEFKAGLSYSF